MMFSVAHIVVLTDCGPIEKPTSDTTRHHEEAEEHEGPPEKRVKLEQPVKQEEEEDNGVPVKAEEQSDDHEYSSESQLDDDEHSSWEDDPDRYYEEMLERAMCGDKEAEKIYRQHLMEEQREAAYEAQYHSWEPPYNADIMARYIPWIPPEDYYEDYGDDDYEDRKIVPVKKTVWEDAYRFSMFNPPSPKNVYEGIPPFVTVYPHKQRNMLCFKSLQVNYADLKEFIARGESSFTYRGCSSCMRGTVKAAPGTVCPLTREEHTGNEICFRLKPRFEGCRWCDLTFFNPTVRSILDVDAGTSDFVLWSVKFMEERTKEGYLEKLNERLEKTRFTVWCARQSDTIRAGGASSGVATEQQLPVGNGLQLTVLKVMCNEV